MDLAYLQIIAIAGLTTGLGLLGAIYLVEIIAKYFIGTLKTTALFVLSVSLIFGGFLIANTFLMHGFVQGFPILRESVTQCTNIIYEYVGWIANGPFMWVFKWMMIQFATGIIYIAYALAQVVSVITTGWEKLYDDVLKKPIADLIY